MALVSRRNLARVLQENRRILADGQHHRHVATLNQGDEESLACEYEVLLLSALSRHGEVIHEPALTGSTKLDVLFRSRNPPFSFLADITAVSDQDAHRRNPVEEFRKALSQLFKKQGLTMTGIAIRIEGALHGTSGKQKMALALPLKAEMVRVAKYRLGGFVAAVKANPGRTHEVVVDDDQLRASIRYDPREKVTSTSHLSFTAPYSKRNNALANALEKKADQLAASGFRGVTGIIACDNGCDSLRNLRPYGGGTTRSFGGSEIIADFFRRHRSVSFVACLCVSESRQPPLRAKHQLSFEVTVFRNPRALEQCPDEIDSLLGSLSGSFPLPESTPENVLHHFAFSGPHSGLSHAGGYRINTRWNMSEIRISARAVLGLLAGVARPSEFLKGHHMTPTSTFPDAVNFFHRQLTSGRLITSARVERTPNEDDDWLVLSFGTPDPAVTPFSVDSSPPDTSSD